MRHHKIGRALGRNSSHRKAMFANMAVSLFTHEQIRTTLPKAKELRRVAVANRRLAYARLRDREAVSKLFDTLGPRFQDRAGGYTRILKCGLRSGDNAPMAYVQLLDRPDIADDPDDE